MTPNIEWRAVEQLVFGGAVGPQLLTQPVSLVVIIIGLMVTSGVVSGYVALFAWQRRSMPGAIGLGVLALASGWWSSGYLLELIVADVTLKLTLADLQWVGVLVAPIAWFFFAFSYAGRDRFTARPSLCVLSVLPVIGLVAVWTNSLHHLMWTSVTVVPAVGRAITILQMEWGPLYWVVLGYSYLLWLAGAVVILRTALDMPDIYRLQAITLVLGTLMPVLGNFATTLLELYGAAIDMTPAAFTFAGLACTVAISRYELLESRPVPRWVARERVVETMADAVVVTDTKWRVTDVNRAAARVLNDTADDLKGRPVGDVIDEFSPDQRDTDQVTVRLGSSQRYFELRTSAFCDHHGRDIGHALVFRDVTDRRLNLQQLEVMNRVLRHNLRTEANLLEGYANLVLDDIDGGEFDDARDHAKTLQDHAKTLVNISQKARKLGVTRGSDGNGDVQLHPAAVQIRAAADAVRTDFACANVRLVELPDRDVVCAPTLEPIVRELVENGVQHNGSSTPVVSVTAGWEDDELVIRIEDNGPGINASELAAIDAHGETQLRHASGLGLWLVKWGVDQLGGTVVFHRREEGGTEVVLRIQAVRAE
ncbi:MULTISPECIES: histidine kinase N-terminal 7TM domain-containing protein [Haloferax]|uniref:histidine kinase n=1 Tax=Haloferax volcanii JCM 10717 TaxID=1227458 RepID=M0I6T3_HALVO|nr:MULTISPECIES: histidine kinase N-terminal 7TM domain-containing protein [Haloferax]ELZ92505.1 putative PAS/PAC sensing his kinase [Haloferax alexandrinus JCM 10717]RDZ37121.1 PAS domain-containing protein [Haloferax sp. Atlit-24N]RLM37918.1 PAS domain-containing protein [Haloferax sp. Atlit-109R]RLM45861.1 PAS domain-containing protein [Haloferax sp. Atlit-105R]